MSKKALGQALKIAAEIAGEQGDGTLTITRQWDGGWEWAVCFGPLKQFDSPSKQRVFEERLLRSSSLKTAIEKCCWTCQGLKTSKYNQAISALSEEECTDIICSDEVIPGI